MYISIAMENFIEAPHFFGDAAIISLVLFSFVLTVVAAHYLLSCKKNEKRMWPPSPPTLPLLGNLHQLNKGGTFLSAANNMAKSYGPVITLWMGTSPVVVLTGQTAIWEALVNQASNFADRPYMHTNRFFASGYLTTMTSDCNESWIKLRKILHSNVISRFHLASHTSSHQRNVNDLINKLVDEMNASNGVVRPLHYFKIMTISFIAQLCFGPDFQDEIFAEKVANCITEYFIVSGRGETVLESIPLASYWNPSSYITQKKGKAMRAGILELFLPIIQSGRSYRAYLKKNAPNCFLNCLLSISEGEEEEVKLKLSDEEITFNLFELFILSVDSTCTALEWALAYLINNPHIQNRVYQELNEAFPEGKEKLLDFEDLGKLPYLQAVVKETLRKDAIAPFGAPHRTVNECKVMGINIPAKAAVLFNLSSVSNDPQMWSNPDEFAPERFLSNNDVRSCYLPFGAGRRICPGMDMTYLHVPITLANIIKTFEWGCVKEGSAPDLSREDHSMLMFMKHPLQARIRRR